MKKIINGVRYDTDNAELLYVEDNGKFSFYRGSNGSFFTFYPTGEIKPRTEEHAKMFLGEVDADKYTEIFGEVEEA